MHASYYKCNKKPPRCYQHQSGNTVSSPFETVERSEHRASRWTAEHILTEEDFREAFAAGYTEPWQLAEYFDLPEQDVMKAFSYWRDCRGIDFS